MSFADSIVCVLSFVALKPTGFVAGRAAFSAILLLACALPSIAWKGTRVSPDDASALVSPELIWICSLPDVSSSATEIGKFFSDLLRLNTFPNVPNPAKAFEANEDDGAVCGAVSWVVTAENESGSDLTS
jgi:hypothetical protein